MRNSLTLWLLSIILLTLISFEAVFKPIWFNEPRRDPSDASRYLRPVGAVNFKPENRPEATFRLFGLNAYVYTPQHDLRLGLDLRGGMRVVLTVPDVMNFVYPLEKALPNDQAKSDKKQALANAVQTLLAKPDPDGFGPKMVEEQLVSVSVEDVSDNQVMVVAITEPTITDVKKELDIINTAMTTAFGADEFTAPKTEVLSNQDTIKKSRAANQESVRTIMESRLNSSGLTEVTAYAEGENRVVLEIPGVKDPDEVRRILVTTAQLEFYLIPKGIIVNIGENDAITATQDGQVIQGGSAQVTQKVLDQSMKVLTGDDLKDFQFEYAQGKPAIGFSVKPEKAQYFGAFTSAHIYPNPNGDVLAIVLDHKFKMVPIIQAAISDNGVIEGNFTEKEAQRWVELLKAGTLPVPVKIAETRTVSATLGADSIARSMVAGLIGLAAVLIFMAAYYRLPGLMANIALIIYIFLSLAVLKLFNATLTLPGIAGVIIAIGMAVDANVIIFERLKEELRTQKPLETAIDVAFSRAWTAILDSNVASLITGAVLYALGTGAVKGFAITLFVGVLVSLFTSVTVTRLFMKLMIRSRAGHKLAWYGV